MMATDSRVEIALTRRSCWFRIIPNCKDYSPHSKKKRGEFFWRGHVRGALTFAAILILDCIPHSRVYDAISSSCITASSFARVSTKAASMQSSAMSSVPLNVFIPSNTPGFTFVSSVTKKLIPVHWSPNLIIPIDVHQPCCREHFRNFVRLLINWFVPKLVTAL